MIYNDIDIMCKAEKIQCFPCLIYLKVDCSIECYITIKLLLTNSIGRIPAHSQLRPPKVDVCRNRVTKSKTIYERKMRNTKCTNITKNILRGHFVKDNELIQDDNELIQDDNELIQDDNELIQDACACGNFVPVCR